jgi:hypothetical protein
MVPSLQPPSVPQPLALPALSFSRKVQPAIPLPPLSKENLTILLKGKNPDQLLAAAPAPAATVSVKKAVPKKPSSKAPKKDVKEAAAPKKVGKVPAAPAPAPLPAEAAAAKAPEEEAAPGVAAKKAKQPKPLPKVNYAQLSANIARNKGLANKRYAGAIEDGDTDEGEGEEQGEEEEEEEQLDWGEQVEDGEGYYEEDPADGAEYSQTLQQEEGEGEGEDGGDELRLEQEYARLREQFNAKLQQAAALNQHQQNQQQEAERQRVSWQDGAAAGAGMDGLVASGKVTQSYSEGHSKISTQDLLRMWELEDAAEEEMRRRAVEEEQGPGQGAAGAVKNNQFSPGNEVLPQQAKGATKVSRARMAHSEEEEESSEDEEGAGMGYGPRRREAPAAQAPQREKEPAVAIPVPSATLSVDDPTLDDHFLSFMNKMAAKIPSSK